MPKVSVKMSGKKALELKEGVETVLNGPAPSLKPDDQLTLNYNLNLGSSPNLGVLRVLANFMEDSQVETTVQELDERVVFEYIEMGRLLQDLMFSYKEKGILWKGMK